MKLRRKTEPMEIKNLKQLIVYAGAVGISILLLFFVIICTAIGYDVKRQCQEAKGAYGGDCVEAFITTLENANNPFRTRNEAIWALGQIGDSRALPVLQSYYTGNIPPREPMDKTISQYELQKAIALAQGEFNLSAWAWRNSLNSSKDTPRETIEETVVVSDPADSYHELAQTISQSENLVMVPDFTQALKFNPKFILFVAAPENLTEERLVNIGNTFKSRDDYPALGFITGSTMELAEQLWLRRERAQEGRNYLGTDVEEGQRISEPLIFNLGEDSGQEIELNKENLIDTLQNADYFYWARHVAANKWHWNTESPDFGENDKLYAEDLPALKPAVIHSPACGSFQPWRDDSIALGFVDHGAAVYIGHLHSPIAGGTFMRQGLLVPGVYTWEGFPIGVMTQIQNKMTTRAVFNTPQYFMLGDPRVYLSKEMPYRIISDTLTEDGSRVILGESEKQGVLPVILEDGAGYEYLKIKGMASAAESDLFYNNNLQTLDLGMDKYILFFHQGGEFRIELSPKAPFLWSLNNLLTDAFDHTWVVIGVVYSPISLFFLALFILILFFKILRPKKTLKELTPIFLAGFLLAALQILHLSAQIDDYSVSSNLVQYTIPEVLLGFVGIFSTTVGGLLMMKEARKALGWISGLVFSVLPQFLLSGFYFGAITYIDLNFRIGNPVPLSLWNYSSFWMPFIVLLFETCVILIVYRYVIVGRKPAGKRL